MTTEEIKLLNVLVSFGNPTNLLIVDSVLSFDLLDPEFGESINGVTELINTVKSEFPEYIYIHKLVNDKNSYWAVLRKKIQ